MRVSFMRTSLVFVVVVAALASARPALALREDAARGDREGEGGRSLDRILDFQMERMTGALKLSDEQVAAISPRVRQLAETQVEARKRRAEILQRLQDDTDAGNDAKAREDLELLRDHDD